MTPDALRAAARRFGTPVYVTSAVALADAAAALRDAFPDPWLRAFSVKANDVPAIIARLGARGARGERRLVAASGPRHGRPASRNDRITLEGIGKTAADLRAAVRAASRRRPAPLGGGREPRGGRGAGGDRPARRARQRRPAAARRPAPPQPGRHARDPGRPGRRSRDLEVRHDRDRADGDRRRDRGRRSAPGARHPPPRRLAAGRGRRVARRRAPGPGAARAHRRGPRRLRHVRRRRRLPGRRPGHGPHARALRGARSSRCSTPCRPIGGPRAWPSSPAGSSWRAPAGSSRACSTSASGPARSGSSSSTPA